MTNQPNEKSRRRVLQLRTTEEFERQVAALLNGTTLRKKSDVVFLAVQELYDRRVRQRPEH